MIVVTAASGQIGSKVLAHLLKMNQPLRIIARRVDVLSPEIVRRVEVVEGSHGQADVVDRAFAGAKSVFWLVAANPQAVSAEASYVDFSTPACEALRRHAVSRVVGISALGRGWSKNAGLVSATHALDDRIAAAGVHYRALCCGSLMENTLRQVRFIKEQGVFYSTAPGDLESSAVATKDVATVAAGLLCNPQWTGVEDIPLKGPANISNNEMARVISDVLNKPVRHQEMTTADFHATILERGASEGMARAMVNMMIAKNEGMDQLVEGPTPALTPTTFHQWCEESLVPAMASANRRVPEGESIARG